MNKEEEGGVEGERRKKKTEKKKMTLWSLIFRSRRYRSGWKDNDTFYV